MDLTIDLTVIINSFLAASFLWYGKQVRDVVILIRLHDYRIEQQEIRIKDLESVHKLSTLTTCNGQ